MRQKTHKKNLIILRGFLQVSLFQVGTRWHGFNVLVSQQKNIFLQLFNSCYTISQARFQTLITMFWDCSWDAQLRANGIVFYTENQIIAAISTHSSLLKEKGRKKRAPGWFLLHCDESSTGFLIAWFLTNEGKIKKIKAFEWPIIIFPLWLVFEICP